MSKNEISVSKACLELCVNDLKAVASQTDGLFKKLTPAPLKSSKGYSAERITDCIGAAGDVSRAFSDLIVNSEKYLEAMKKSFENADAAAAKTVDNALT